MTHRFRCRYEGCTVSLVEINGFAFGPESGL